MSSGSFGSIAVHRVDFVVIAPAVLPGQCLNLLARRTARSAGWRNTLTAAPGPWSTLGAPSSWTQNIPPSRAPAHYLSPSVRTHARLPACVLVRILLPRAHARARAMSAVITPPHTRTRGRCVAKLPHACAGAYWSRNASPTATGSILSWLNFPLTRGHVGDVGHK